MRFRKIVGMAAGALVAGAVTVPVLSAPASAAPSATSVSRDFSCSFSSFTINYEMTAKISADGTAVTATLSDLAATSFPTGLKIDGFDAEIGLTLDGEAVTLTGENTYVPRKAGGGSGVTVQLPMPSVEGTRTGTADLVAGSLTSLDLNMRAGFQFNPNVPVVISDNQLTCVAGAEPIKVSQEFSCAFGDFTLPFDVSAFVRGKNASVGAVMDDMYAANLPTGLKIAGFKAEVGLDLGAEDVAVSGENTFDPPRSGGGSGTTTALPMPALSGPRTGSDPVTEAVVTSLDLVMKAGFQFGPNPPTISDQQLECATPECLTAQDEQAAAQDDVTTAEEAVTGAEEAVTTAQASVTTAQAGVTTATKAVTAAQAKVKTLTAKVKALTAKVKTLSKKKQTPAVKRQLKAAKKQLATAKAQLKTAQAQLKTAQAKLMTAKSSLTSAQVALTEAQSGLTSAQAALTEAEGSLALADAAVEELCGPTEPV